MSSAPASTSEPLLPKPRFSIYDKQQEVLESDARYRILRWGRRGGKNIVAVIDLVERGRHPWTYQWGTDDPANTVIWWVGPSYNQAKKYGFQPLKSALPDRWIARVSNTEPYEIELINGVLYEFRTFDKPKTIQGAGVDHLVIDEGDYMPDNLWYQDLDPMLMDSMGSMMAISKPVRPRSYFNTFYEYGQSADYPEHFSSHATSSDNPFIAESPEDKRGTVPNHVFRREYLAELPDDGGQVFKKLGDRLFTESYPLEGEVIEGIGEVSRPAAECTPPFSVGVDFARHRDYRVTTALDAEGYVVYFSRDQNEGWDTIQSDIEAVHASYPGIVVPDASRDNKIIPDLAMEGVTLEPTSFSPKRKKELIENLITLIETGEITASSTPALDQLRLELRRMEKEVTNNSYTRYNAPDNGHDDCVDSLALAASKLDRIQLAARRGWSESDDTEENDGGISYA